MSGSRWLREKFKGKLFVCFTPCLHVSELGNQSSQPKLTQRGVRVYVARRVWRRSDNVRIMKKTFKLNVEGKHPDRVLEAVKHEIRKYVKRQRRVPLPEGVDFWDFDCRFGASETSATVVHFATITALIDAVARGGAEGEGVVRGDSFYLELLAKNGVRKVKDKSVEIGDQGLTPGASSSMPLAREAK